MMETYSQHKKPFGPERMDDIDTGLRPNLLLEIIKARARQHRLHIRLEAVARARLGQRNLRERLGDTGHGRRLHCRDFDGTYVMHSTLPPRTIVALVKQLEAENKTLREKLGIAKEKHNAEY